MRFKLFVCAALLISAVELFAQAAPVAPAAPAATPAVAPAAAPLITWSGLAMIRLREDIIRNTAADKTETSSKNYSNRLAYKLGAKIQANPEVSLMFEIGNEWYATELVNGGNTMTMPASVAPGSKRGLYDPMFLQAWAKWDPGYMHVQVGIDPIKGSATMDLIGMSLLFNRNYVGAGFHACQLPWGVTNNFMYPGLRIGAPILTDNVKLGIDVFSGVSEERSVTTTTAALSKNNYGALLNIVDIPVSSGDYSITPQFVIILNRNFRDDAFVKNKADHEIGFGVDESNKLNDMISVRSGVAMAMVSNKNTARASAADTVVGVAEYDRQALNVTLGSTIKLGPGKLDLDLNFGTNEDKKINNSLATYEFLDVKYGWGVAKNFIVMPRVRVYLGQVPAVGFTDKASNIRVWPELLLFGSF
jgi:hypothetical protein